MTRPRAHGTCDREGVPREVDVAPAQRQQLSLPKSGVCSNADDLAILAILRMLLLPHGWPCRVAVQPVGESSRQSLDLLGRVERQHARPGFATLVRAGRRVRRQTIRSVFHAVAVDGGDERAVLVHRPSRRFRRAHGGEHRLNVPDGHRRGRQCAEYGHDVPRRLALPSLVGDAGLTEQVGVVGERRWLRALHVGKPAQVAVRDLAERHASRVALALDSLAVARVLDVGGDELCRGDVGPAFVVETLTNAAATRTPAACGGIALKPSRTDATLDLASVVAELRLVEDGAAFLADHDSRSRTRGWHPLTAASRAPGRFVIRRRLLRGFGGHHTRTVPARYHARRGTTCGTKRAGIGLLQPHLRHEIVRVCAVRTLFRGLVNRGRGFESRLRLGEMPCKWPISRGTAREHSKVGGTSARVRSRTDRAPGRWRADSVGLMHAQDRFPARCSTWHGPLDGAEGRGAQKMEAR